MEMSRSYNTDISTAAELSSESVQSYHGGGVSMVAETREIAAMEAVYPWQLSCRHIFPCEIEEAIIAQNHIVAIENL